VLVTRLQVMQVVVVGSIGESKAFGQKCTSLAAIAADFRALPQSRESEMRCSITTIVTEETSLGAAKATRIGSGYQRPCFNKPRWLRSLIDMATSYSRFPMSMR
jgi:hypothetical protein